LSYNTVSTIKSFFCTFNLVFPIIFELLHPFEIGCGGYIRLSQFINDISGMYINGYQGNNDFSLDVF
jgi:hypothetical protein